MTTITYVFVVAAFVLLFLIILRTIIRDSELAAFGRQRFARLRREIQHNTIQTHLPLILHELRELSLGAAEKDKAWAAFHEQWLDSAPVVEGYEANSPAMDGRIGELLDAVGRLKVSRRVALALAANAHGGPPPSATSSWNGVMDAAALVLSIVSLCLAVMSQRSADSQFERQKRPWLRVPAQVNLNHTSYRDSESVDFEIANRSSGAAEDCRCAVVMNGEAAPVHLERRVASVRPTPDMAYLPPGDRDQLVQATAWIDTMSVASTADSFVHICLYFKGLETGLSYYLEQTVYVGYAEPEKHASPAPLLLVLGR